MVRANIFSLMTLNDTQVINTDRLLTAETLLVTRSISTRSSDMVCYMINIGSSDRAYGG
jgi:hypothetical protein